MGRRIRWLGLVIVLCFVLVLIQLVNIQVRQGSALANSAKNPRNEGNPYNNLRGSIFAADGTELAYSVPAKPGSGPYRYQRVYPTGTLFSDVVGYDSSLYGTQGVEYEYNDQLQAHRQGPQSFSQFLGGQSTLSTDDVTLTLQPSVQQAATQALLANPNPNKDGAVVVLDPRSGDVLAMASNPTFDPNAISSPDVKTQEAARTQYFEQKDAEGIYPGYPVATFVAFAPGSTFKVVTSTAVYNLVPSLTNFTWPSGGGEAGCTSPGEIPLTDKLVCNDADTPQQATPCGGTMVQMLPQSCDPGYAVLGLKVGPQALNEEATLFGYDSKPPIDLNPSIVSVSNFPTEAELATSAPDLAYSAFGQQNVTATALQNAMVAAGIANNGALMTPHVMADIHDSQGNLVQTYRPKLYKQVCPAGAAQQVNQLMQGVVANGTAANVGFPQSEHVAAKTGTAQTTDPTTHQPETDDWMIAFAPANDPTVAAAVMVPYQPVSASGAEVAGPIMKAVLQAALAAQQAAAPPPTTTTTAVPAHQPFQTTTTGGGPAPTTTPVTSPAPTTTTTLPPTTTTVAPATTAPEETTTTLNPPASP